MFNIRTVNLVWEQRVRGVYPVARYALHDDGTLVVAAPRPLEPRTYDLTRLTLDGGAELRGSFAVETLLKLEVTALADHCLGMTSDDLYLFREGGKFRFMPDRWPLNIDVALSADGRRVAAIFSDMSGASFAVAYGEIGGRVLWTRETSLTPTVVAISRNGEKVAMGTENGAILLLDAARRDVWEFGQSEPVRAVACSDNGLWVAYGTELGGVGLVDGQGGRRWEARLPGEVTGLALSGDGSLCMAVCRPEGDSQTSLLFGIIAGGQIAWEYDSERPLTGLSLAANGRYLATSARSGILSVYEVVASAEAGVVNETAPEDALARSEELVAAGDLAAACRALRAALDADPTAVEACECESALRIRLQAERCAQAQALCDAGDFAAAIATLEEALQDDPLNTTVITMLLQARQGRGQQLLAQARAHAADAEEEAAEADLLEALTIAPNLLDARRELRALRQRRAAAADAAAERLLAESEWEAGVAALEHAQAIAPDAQRARRLEHARTAMEFAAGMVAYDSKRYREAIYQFKKVLLRDPDHAEAQRYLDYAQKFAQDASTESLNDRFRLLE